MARGGGRRRRPRGPGRERRALTRPGTGHRPRVRFQPLAAAAAIAASACIIERGPSPDSARRADSAAADIVMRTDAAPVARAPAPRAPPAGAIDTLVALGPREAEVRDSARRGDPPVTAADRDELRRRTLLVPVAGVAPSSVLDTFGERRGGGARAHAALDIPAPRGTPVLSADAGRVLKLHTSRGGGLTIYVGDPSGRFILYYAHLDGYRAGLAEGQLVRRGEVLGYVGTTGNAPPNVPHLHFAVARSNDFTRWWAGTPLDPRPYLVDRSGNR